MAFPIATRFMDRTTETSVTGSVQATDDRDMLAWTSWRYREQDEDRNWDWRKILQECRASGKLRECYSATVQLELHGLMSLDLKGQHVGKARGVVVEYLTTNPDNRNPRHGLKHVGVALLAVAIRRSLACGMSGRLWLESLHGATDFYARLGMARADRLSADHLAIYTLDSDGAQEFLEKVTSSEIIQPGSDPLICKKRRKQKHSECWRPAKAEGSSPSAAIAHRIPPRPRRAPLATWLLPC